MPNFNITGPDGHHYSFSAPEGTSQLEALNFASLLYDKRQAELKANQNKGTAGDFVTATKQGVAQLPGAIAGLADIPLELLTGENYLTEAGNKIANATGIHPSDYAASLEQEKSAKYQAAQTEANALWDAQKKGESIFSGVGDLAAFYAKHPALTATKAVESVPSMLLGGAYSRGLKLAGATAKGLAGAIARGSIGEGAVSAGQSNQQLAEEGGGSRQKALAALAGGVGTAAFAGVSGKLASHLGIIDPETFLAGAAKNFTQEELDQFAKVANQGIAKRLGLGALQEGLLQELPQSIQEQMFQNWGGGKPIMDGVARNAVEGALAGAVMGGGFNTLAGNPAKAQLQAREEAQAATAQAQAEQAQRQATGVMEQQPLFNAEQAPEIPEPTTTPPISTVAPEPAIAPESPINVTRDEQGNYIAEPQKLYTPESSPDQGRLFNTKGNPTPEAKASVEAARLQGLPDTIAALSVTPEGRAELSSNRKMYFPDLTTKERNAKIVEIQRAGNIVEPAPEGTLTPALLSSFGIRPNGKNNKQIFDALNGQHLADPTTYNLLATLADNPKSSMGIPANNLLMAYPHYSPTAAQPDLFTGEQNAPQTKTVQVEPTQQTLFGVPESGAQTNPVEQAVEPSMAEPLQPEEAPVQAIEEPIQRGLGDAEQPTSTRNEQPKLLPAAKPNTLDRFPRVDAIPGINLGPGGLLKPKVVAEGSPLFRETNMGGLDALLRSDRDFDPHKIYVSNNPDLALGQGTNKGVNIEFRPNSISGAENVKPGNMGYMGDITGKEYVSDIIAPRAISKITITKPKLLKELRWLSGRTLQGQFDRVDNKDGSVTFTRKDLAPLIPADKPNPLAKQAAATLKKEPIAKAWEHLSDIPYAALSKIGKTLVGDAQKGGYLHQITADRIMATEARNKKVTATNKTNVAETPIDETPVAPTDDADLKKALATLGAGLQQRIAPTQNLTPEERISVAQMLSALGDVMYLLVKKGVKSFAQAMTEAKKTLGPNANLISDEQYKQAYDDAQAKLQSSSPKVASHQINPTAQAQAKQTIANMSGTLVASAPKAILTPTQALQNIATTVTKNPGGVLAMIENNITKFRNLVVNKQAHLIDTIQAHYDNAFRHLNGDVVSAFILDSISNVVNFTNAVFTEGGMSIKADKSFIAKKEQYSMVGVLSAAEKLASRIGKETALKLITGAFYHYRAEAVMKLPKADWPKNWLADPRMVPTPAQIKAGRDAFAQNPELEEMRKQFIGSKNQMVNFLFDAGFLTKGKRDAFLADSSYAPWLRIKEYDVATPGLGNIGRIVDLSQMKALVGGTEEVNDMLENMTQIIGWFARSGMANHSANLVLNDLVSFGKAKQFKARPGTGDPNHIIMTYVDGVPTFWHVDNPLDVQAFLSVRGLNSEAARMLNKGMGALRTAIVLFPMFPLRQIAMDTQRAYMQSGVEHPGALVGEILKSFISGEAYRGTDHASKRLGLHGVVGEFHGSNHDLSDGLIKQHGLSTQKESLTDKWAKNPIYIALRRFNYSADAAVRIGIYKQTMKETGDESLAVARARAIYNAHKTGTSETIQTLKIVVPFLGAYAEGMDVNYRSMIGRGNSMKSRKAAAAAYWGNVAMYASLVVAYTMCMSGDDEYEDQKDRVINRNFIIPGIGLLPVPTDAGFLAKVIPERITHYIMQQSTDNPESARRLRMGILETAVAGFLPPANIYGVTPVLSLMANHDFFTDMPIVSQYYQGLENSEQHTPSTSEFAKAIGSAANMSPLQIDYVLKAIGGTSAGALLQLADIMVGDGKMATDKTPIISTFQLPSVGGRYTEDFYAIRELTGKAYNTQKLLYERGDEAALAEYQDKPEIQARLGLRPQIEAIHSIMNNLQHQRKMIELSDLDPQAKRDAVNELNARQEQLLKEAGIGKLRIAAEEGVQE